MLLSPLLVVLVLAEAGTRIFFRDEVDSQRLRERNQRLSIGHLIEPAADPELLYELKKGLFTEWSGVLVRTSDTEPARISTFLAPPPPEAIRIALLGDSSAFGWRIEYESTYAEIVRRKLEQRLGFPVELRNYALPGYGSLQSRIRFETNVVPWKPDLVILHYDHNDSEPTNTAPANYIAPEYGDNILRSAFIKHILRRLRVIRNERTVHFAEIDHGEELKSGDPWHYESALWKAHAAELSRIGRVAAEHDIPALAFVWCNAVERTASGWNEDHLELIHRPLLEVMERAGLYVFDLYPFFRSHMEAAGWEDLRPFHFSDHDRHPTRSCHAFLAEHVFDYILRTPAILDRLEQAAENAGTDAPPALLTETGDSFRGAMSLAAAGRFEEAEALLREVVAGKPDDPAIRMSLFEVLLTTNKAEAAEEQLNEIVALKPDYVQPRLRLAKYLTATGQHERAVDHLEKAVANASSRYVKSSAMNALGEALFAANRVTEAEKLYYEMRDFLEKDGLPLVVLAGHHVARGDLARAETHLENALEDNPSNTGARFLLAEIYEKQRRAAEAIELFDSILEEDPENIDCLTRIAWLTATSPGPSKHDIERAVDLAQKACQLSSEQNPASLSALAVALAGTGDFDRAVKAIDKAIALQRAANNEAELEELQRMRAGFERGGSVLLAPTVE